MISKIQSAVSGLSDQQREEAFNNFAFTHPTEYNQVKDQIVAIDKRIQFKAEKGYNTARDTQQKDLLIDLLLYISLQKNQIVGLIDLYDEAAKLVDSLLTARMPEHGFKR